MEEQQNERETREASRLQRMDNAHDGDLPRLVELAMRVADMSWAGNPQIHACDISLEMSEHFSNIFDSFLGMTQKNSTICLRILDICGVIRLFYE